MTAYAVQVAIYWGQRSCDWYVFDIDNVFRAICF